MCTRSVRTRTFGAKPRATPLNEKSTPAADAGQILPTANPVMDSSCKRSRMDFREARLKPMHQLAIAFEVHSARQAHRIIGPSHLPLPVTSSAACSVITILSSLKNALIRRRMASATPYTDRSRFRWSRKLRALSALARYSSRITAAVVGAVAVCRLSVQPSSSEPVVIACVKSKNT